MVENLIDSSTIIKYLKKTNNVFRNLNDVSHWNRPNNIKTTYILFDVFIMS